MTKYKRRTYDPAEVVNAFSPKHIEQAEERYAATNDPAFIVLALGASPVRPPDWAVQAAIELSHAVSMNHSKGLEPEKLGAMLDEIIAEYCRNAPAPPDPISTPPRKARIRPGRGTRSFPYSSLDALIRKVLAARNLREDDDRYPAARARIISAWNEEAESATEVDHNGMPWTPRFLRVALGSLDPNEDRHRRNSTLATWMAHRLKEEIRGV